MHSTALFAAATFLVALGALGATTLATAFPRSTQTEVRAPLGTGFTYQGRIEIDGVPYTGGCGLRFTLWDAAVGGTTVGSQQTISTTATNGTFSVVLNSSNQFGAGAFSGDARWIQTEARCPNTGDFTSLGRTQITPVPYATFAMDAGDSVELGGFPAADYARFARVVIVPADSNDPFVNGAALTAALAAISDASSQKPYLLLLEPGDYSLTQTLQMKQNVQIAGVPGGESVIRSSSVSPVVRTVSGAALENLTVGLVTNTDGAAIELGEGRTTLNRVKLQSAATGIDGPTPATFAVLEMKDSVIDLTCGNFNCAGIKVKGGTSVRLETSTIGLYANPGTLSTVGISSQSIVTLTDSAISAPGTVSMASSRGIETTSAIEVTRSTIYAGPSQASTGIETTNTIAALDSIVRILGSNAVGRGIQSSGPVLVRNTWVVVEGTSRAGILLLGAGTSTVEYSIISTAGTGAGSPAVQTNGSVTIRHSTLTSASTSPSLFVQSGSTNVFFTELRGGAAFSTGSMNCSATTDEANTFYAGNPCP